MCARLYTMLNLANVILLFLQETKYKYKTYTYIYILQVSVVQDWKYENRINVYLFQHITCMHNISICQCANVCVLHLYILSFHTGITHSINSFSVLCFVLLRTNLDSHKT